MSGSGKDDPNPMDETHAGQGCRCDGLTTHDTVILVVDDDERTRSTIAKWLRTKGGARVLTATDNTSALRHLRQSHVDLIIQDLKRPGGGGIELLQVLKGDPQFSSIRVIVLSGYAAGLREALREGAESVLLKPVGPEELLRAVGGTKCG